MDDTDEGAFAVPSVELGQPQGHADDSSSAAALVVLLEANGYSTEDAAESSRLAQITKLEMFLQDYPKMVALCFFSNLTELQLIDQRIEKIEGLQGCPHLKKLWLIENRIGVIENLEPCTELQELYLTSNRITAIAGVAHLTGLKVLWLADNYVSSLTGIEQLADLQELNVARNDITQIGTSLLPSSRLTSLNLADNQISSLQDVVSGFSSLTSLQDLCLGDPFWGDCPVTSLSNYQTFMLAQLPQLSSLDTLVLAAETKAAAAATFAKKKLYYNMRRRTMRRGLEDLCRHAKAAQQAQASPLLVTYEDLSRAAKQLQSQQHGGAEGAQQQVQALQACMQAVEQHLASQQLSVDQDCHAARAALQAVTARLQLDLGSAGNIWLEEGRPTDAWVQSCQELVCSSRLGPQAGQASSAPREEWKVVAATRIHNRHLRTQFGRHWQPGDTFEYLFFADPAADLMSVAQHGFKAVVHSDSQHTPAAVQLTSHLSLPVPSSQSSTTSSSMPGGPQPQLQVLVCRACLNGPCKALPEAGSLQDASLPEDFDTQQSSGLQAAYSNISSSNCSGSSGSSGTRATSRSSSMQQQGRPQQRLWHVFDHTTLLPEYILTCKLSSTPPEAPAEQAQDSSMQPSGRFSCEDPLLQLSAQPLDKWLSSSSTPAAGLTPSIGSLQSRCRQALAAVAVPSCPRLPRLSSAALAVAANNHQLHTLTQLYLQDCGLSNFAGLLRHLPSLSVLALPFNHITSLAGLADGAAGNVLGELDVSHNQIELWSESWLADCTALTALDASCNVSTQPGDLQPLVRSAPQLQDLDLFFNPVRQHKAYSVVLSALTRLSQLDRAPVLAQQQGLQAGTTGVTAALLRERATLWHSNSGPVATLQTLGASDWRQLLHSVVLDGQGLRSLQGLAAACNLVTVSLADNLISDLQELAACSKLQCLDISSNLVSELGPVAGLVSLQQLDVSCNQLSSLFALSGLSALTQLTCEGNGIASLVGIGSLSSLVELYAAHNNIGDVKEAERLSMLPNLVVLDLVGNPLVVATEGYRLLLLFKLRCLKVLDGTAADAAELASAQAQHAGRLTLSMVEEQLGSQVELLTLRHLDLSAVGIRGLGSVFAASGPLTALTGLNLDGNQLSSLAPLAGLSHLLAFSICNNRPADAGQLSSLCFALPAQPATGPQGPTSSTPTAPKVFLPSLQTLHMAGCGLASLVPLQLQCLPALRSLFVQGNELSRLDGLEGLLQLKELVADKNRIRVLDPEVFSSLVRLQELRLEENAIRSINPAAPGAGGMGACLPQLHVLLLGSNRMMDAAECVRRLADIPLLAEVTVAGNPFARKQPYRQMFIEQCAQLQVLDEQPILAEEREYIEAMLAAAEGANFGPEVPQFTAQMLLAATAEAPAPPTVLPLARLPAARTTAPEMPSPKAGHGLQGLAAALSSYEGLANLAAARQALLLGGLGQAGHTGGLLPTSVPSIQSGVLVLTGPASFGLEGTAMRGSSSPGGSSGAAGSPASSPSKGSGLRQQQQAQSSPEGVAARGAGRRTTTGSIASYRAGGFVVRQATFQR